MRKLIDFEFTNIGGEINRMQIVDENGLQVYDFKTTKPQSVIAIVKTGGIIEGEEFFTKEFFDSVINEDDILFGWGIQEDRNILSSYGIFEYIIDLQEMFIHANPLFVVENGRSIEVANYFFTNKIISKHNGEELIPLYNHYIRDNNLIETYFYDLDDSSIIPYGRFSGEEIGHIVATERRAIDGYRFNNTDYLSKMYDNFIYRIENEEEEEDDEDLGF
jgi:hypothetical protein